MVLDERTHKSVVSVGSGGGGKDGKVAVIGVLANNPKPTADKEGIATIWMEVSMIRLTWYGVANPYIL